MSVDRNISYIYNKINRLQKVIAFFSRPYIENINHCIAEKTQKIQRYKDKYQEWWLVLVDFLVGGIGEPERTIVIQNIINIYDWKKVIVIHPVTLKEILKIG